MSNPRIGGRGKKLPYRTVIKRIPEPIAQEIEELAQSYINYVTEISTIRSTIVLSDSELRNKIRQILKQKKSAKYSMKKLLQVLFGKEVDINL